MPYRFPIYNQINLRERQIIERLYTQGYTPGKIARQVFRSRSTITREIQRNGHPDKNGKWQYSARIAQRFYEYRQRRTGNIRGANRLHKREPSGNYIHTTPVIPLFRIRTLRGFHIELKRWFRKYKLSRWHEHLPGRRWRSSYNWLRNRCYSWEEMGRRFKKTHYSPYSFHERRLARFRRHAKSKFRYKDYSRISDTNRSAGERLSDRRNFTASRKKLLYFSLEPCTFPKERQKKQRLTSPSPLHRIPAQHPGGTAMSKNCLNKRFFKIPSPA